MTTTAIIIIGTAVLLLLIFVSIYNGLIRRRNEVDNVFGGMDVQLKKRYDLIPNLVEVVKQYASHEKELLIKITDMRVKAISSNLSSDEKVSLDDQIQAGIKSIMVAVENYPNLKANENFLNLQSSLNEIESQISAARRTYNAVVTDYNNGIQTFPQNIIANRMGMTKKKVLDIPEEERQNIDVKNLF